MTREERWSYASYPLTNAAAAVKGQMAFLDTSSGKLNVGATSTTLKPIGYFDESATGDGTTEVRVRLFREVVLHWFKNDTGTAVTAANRGSSCYVVDGQTVSGSSATNTRSVAGVVWAVSSTYGVLISPAMPD